jgi:hypothetical protein
MRRKQRSTRNAFQHPGTGNNMLNFDMMDRETSRNEIMCAQAQTWKDEAKSFDILGRLVDMRLPAASSSSSAQADHKAALNPKLASFGRTLPTGPAPLILVPDSRFTLTSRQA